MRTVPISPIRFLALAAVALLVVCFTPRLVDAQGTITGRVTQQSNGEPLSGVNVAVQGLNIVAVTGNDGRYTLQRVPAGQQTLVFRQLGQRPTELVVSVTAGVTVTADVALEFQPIALSEIVVTGASRVPERVVDAPAAVVKIDPTVARDVSPTGQAPRALENVPGVDVVQSGINDFNVNARGFNSSLNRRVLVLQDGRDLSIAFLGSQEWNTLSIPLEDFSSIEMVRGPGSALYGANAFAGVLNVTTPPARDMQGTRVTLAGGELSTFRGDLTHAGVFGEGRFGYRVSGGYSRSDTWSRSRTLVDGTSLQTEYAEATDSVVDLDVEIVALSGQTINTTTGAPEGDRDAVTNIYGSGRFDYYAPGGSVFTIDGGAARSENEVAVTGIGRVQVLESLRPWARANWAAENFNVMAWYSGRETLDDQVSLSAGIPFEESSTIMHVEGQYNRSFLEDRGRVVVGASFRNTWLDTKGTLMALADDNRSDQWYAGFGQVEFKIVPQLKAVGAIRVDEGDLIEAQVSPKGALVYSPTEYHSFRFTYNRAFQTPNYSEFFLQAPADAPQPGPRQVELGVEQLFGTINGGPLAPAFADLMLPSDLPWDFSDQTLALALGNPTLEVETVNSFEIGYKGNVTPQVYATIDGYYSELENFVTDLLPGVNPAFPSYSLMDQGTDVPQNLADVSDRIDLLEAGMVIDAATAAALRAPIPTLQAGYAAVEAGAGALLATMPDGSRAIVVSYGNAGRVTEVGVEVGIGVQLTDEVKADASYTYFDFDVKEQQLGDVLLPNTPQHKVTGSLAYRGRQGFDAAVSARWVDGYQWAAGVFSGWIPSSFALNASAGYQINNYVRIFATGTNLIDQERFHLYGGSVVGRRVLGGLTATF